MPFPSVDTAAPADATAALDRVLLQRVLRLCAALQQLNGRIAQLARALHLSLASPAALDHALQSLPEGRDRRTARLHAELRGLLVLRYTLVRQYCRRYGAPLTGEFLAYAEDCLLAQGYAPGEDGAAADLLAKNTSQIDR